MLHASRYKTIDRFSFLKQSPLQHRAFLGALLFVTVLTILSTPLFIALSAGTDPYGFFTIDTIAEPPMPVILTIMVNVAVSFLCVAIYRWLVAKVLVRSQGRFGAWRRALLTLAPPVIIGMAPGLLLGSSGGKPYYLLCGILVFLALCVTAAVRSPDFALPPGQAKVWLFSSIGFITVLLVLAIQALLLLYFTDAPPPLTNYLWEWKVDWERLGYSEHEFAQRHRDGLIAFGIAGIAYMVFVP